MAVRKIAVLPNEKSAKFIDEVFTFGDSLHELAGGMNGTLDLETRDNKVR